MAANIAKNVARLNAVRAAVNAPIAGNLPGRVAAPVRVAAALPGKVAAGTPQRAQFIPAAKANIGYKAAKLQGVNILGRLEGIPRAPVKLAPGPRVMPAQNIAQNVQRLKQVQAGFAKAVPPVVIPASAPAGKQFNNAVAKLKEFIKNKERALLGAGALEGFHNLVHNRNGSALPSVDQLPPIEQQTANSLQSLSNRLVAVSAQAPVQEQQVISNIDAELKAHAARVSEEAVAAGNMVAMQNDFNKMKEDLQAFQNQVLTQTRAAVKDIVEEAKKAQENPSLKKQLEDDFKKKLGMLTEGLQKIDRFEQMLNEMMARIGKLNERLDDIKKENDDVKHLVKDVEKLESLKTVQQDPALLKAVDANKRQLDALTEKVNALTGLVRFGYNRVQQDVAVQVRINHSERDSLRQQITVAARLFQGATSVQLVAAPNN